MSLSLSTNRKQHKKRTIQHLSQWQNRLANLTSGNKLNFRSWMSRIVEPVLFTLICTVIQCLRWKLNVFLCIYMPLKFPFGIISPEINAHKIYLSVTHSHIRLDSCALAEQKMRFENPKRLFSSVFAFCVIPIYAVKWDLIRFVWYIAYSRCSHSVCECEKDVKRKTCIRTSYHNESKRIFRQICLLETEQMRFKVTNWNKSLNSSLESKKKTYCALSFYLETFVNWHLNSCVQWNLRSSFVFFTENCRHLRL